MNGRERRRRWRDRSTGDVLVLMIATTICGGVVLTAAATVVFAFLHPGTDVTGPARFIADVVNTLIGLLAGFLAGRTDATLRLRRNGNGDAGPGDE